MPRENKAPGAGEATGAGAVGIAAGDTYQQPHHTANGAGFQEGAQDIEQELAEQYGGALTSPAEIAAKRLAEEAEKALLKQGAHDEGNAQTVHLRYHNRFCHNDAFGWMHHTGSHWTTEGAEAALDRAIVETLGARIEAALHSGAADKHSELIKRCIPTAGKVQGAKYLLESLAYVSPYAFDTEPDLLNCANGVVDLRTGQLISHSPSQRFTHCTAVGYEPKADASVWLAFLAEVVGGGPDALDWLQMAVGYTLTGHTREEILFYLFGLRRSGKGTFTETLLALLGSPLAKEVNFGTFTAQRTGDSQNFDLAPLRPCRLVAASESNSYERFNEAKLKALTGGNEVYCAFKHRDHFNYRPQFKIWLSSNEPVNADPDDDAVWGRLRVLSFPISHAGHEDKLLKQRMRSPEVLKGVLAWAVEGARRWYELGSSGLPELPISEELKEKQRESLDAVQMWLEECRVNPERVPADAFMATADLYSSYRRWCEGNGQTPKQMKGFTQALTRKGFAPDRARDEKTQQQQRGFRGLQVL